MFDEREPQPRIGEMTALMQAVLSQAAQKFYASTQATTEKFIADYRRDEAQRQTPEAIDAYCAGFREAVQLFAAVYIGTRL